MFSLAANLVTQLSFPHSQMHKIGKKEYLLAALRDKLQGRFYHEYGVIVQIADFKAEDQAESPFSLPTIDEHTCSLHVRFSAISFKGT